jgi:hypothetical protein
MKIYDQLKKKRGDILRIASQHGAYNVRVFGSVVRDDADSKSDIDFLVDMETDRSLFDLGGLLMDLKALLKRDIDVVTEKSLHWYIRNRVIKESKRL